MAHLLNPFALVVSEVDSTEGTNLEEELAKFEANHEKDMIQFNESIAKLNDDLIEANEKQAAINENQANLNKRVDARLSNLELLNPPEFSPAPHVRAPFTTRKFLKQ